jgi:polyferredoxin
MVAMAKTQPSRTSRFAHWRTWLQAAFLLVWLDPLMLRLHNVCSPVFHCYACPLAAFACPIGVIANFSALHVVPFMAIGTLLLVGVAVGGFVCGWACPFGFLQDLMGRIPVRKFDLPSWTGIFRYGVLIALVLAVPFLFGEGHPLFVCRLCPAGALEGAGPAAVTAAVKGQPVVWPNAAKLIILALFLAAVFIQWRPWCRLLCPLGAIFGLFNRASLLVLRRDQERCDDCGRCRKPCKYGVVPETQTGGTRCIRCLECTRCNAIVVAGVFGQETATTSAPGLPQGPR